jgi:Flp pilus assembly protein TadG
MILRNIRSKRAGQAMVEFALLVPVFFMILVGLLDFGRAGFYYVAASGLSRSAARYGAAYADANGQGFTDAQIVSMLTQQANAETIRITQPAGCGTLTPPSPLTACYQPPSGQAYIFIDRSNFSTLPKFIKVSVVYRFDATTPMVRAIVGTIYVRATSSMETEF